jgi:hypothetical protein
MVSVLKNPPACLLFHARHPARFGGLAMLPAILRKSLHAGTANARSPHSTAQESVARSAGEREALGPRGQQSEHCVSSLPRGFDQVALDRRALKENGQVAT